MDIILLCAGSLIATVLAWLYLSVQEELKKPNGAGESDLPAAEAATAPAGMLVQRPTGKRMLFLGLMFVMLCTLSAVLVQVYENNTIIANGKLITLVALLFIAANIDARQKIIPNAIVLAGLVFRIFFWIAELISAPNAFWDIMKNDLVACLLVVFFFVIGVLLVKGGIGMGDIKLMLVMCLFQGFYGVISSLFCSLFAAFIYAIIVLLTRKKTRKDSIAFAPAILVGTILSVVLTGM